MRTFGSGPMLQEGNHRFRKKFFWCLTNNTKTQILRNTTTTKILLDISISLNTNTLNKIVNYMQTFPMHLLIGPTNTAVCFPHAEISTSTPDKSSQLSAGETAGVTGGDNSPISSLWMDLVVFVNTKLRHRLSRQPQRHW